MSINATQTTTPILPKDQAAALINSARIRQEMTWASIADRLGTAPVWTTAALLGQHPMSAEQADAVCALLGLGSEVAESLRLQPSRGTDPALMADPTIYRLTEAVSVYGPALKALIHEEFGDGIMSAINFHVDIQRRPDPDGDRVVITLDGKFLDYCW
ncbi:cyanase [Micrococcus terreus]|uniref:cyanase n=1 Tax=Micrococcus terreus TaxID=574650 RepID=UPI000DB2B165|nr:cyanase [Micrococcus terreus]MCT2087749.1 cyanase [Micrococcus terreus]PZT92607.1 MAG: cyanase [Gordonia sp. (in: high G+C Gram-positive bacteria)]